jgi:hypothetical protein
MGTFAVLNGESVTNVIIADDLETANSFTHGTCVEYTEENPATIGSIYRDGKFFTPEGKSLSPVVEENLVNENSDEG